MDFVDLSYELIFREIIRTRVSILNIYCNRIIHTVRKPPNSCPQSIVGLLSAVARMKPPNIEPIPVRIPIFFTFLHGMKKAIKAMIGLAVAFKVTARW